MVWKRFAGGLARQRLTICWSAGEASSGAGSLCRIAAIVEIEFSPLKARRPLSSSYSTAPKLNTSERASSGLPSACSGAIYAAVPITVPSMVRVSSESVTCLASPKSSSFTEPSVVTMMLAGFRSRCTTPLRCAASNASAICVASRTASAAGCGPRIGAPSMYSSTR